MSTPRLRSDLDARPVNDGGLAFFDVSDPRSGASMRLYEHEWLIARKMDGRASLEDVASWAGQNVGFAPSAGDLRVYAQRLGELGFFDEPPSAQAPAAAEPPARPVDETSFEDVDTGSMSVPLVTPRPRARTAPPRDADATDVTRPPPFDSYSPPEPEPATYQAPPPPRRPPPERAVERPEPPLQAERAPDRKATSRRLEAEDDTEIVEAPVKKKSRGAMIGLIVLLLLAGGGAAAYYFVIAPALAPAHVKVQAIGGPHDIPHYYEGKGVIARAPAATLSFTSPGVIIDVVAKGTEVKPGQTLASFDTYTQLQRELSDLRDRETYYEEAVKKAQARKRAGEIKRAQTKLNEKKSKRIALEERVNGARIVSTMASTVDDVMVKVGDEVEGGTAILKLADKKLRAEVKLAPGTAKGLKVDSVVTVTNLLGTVTGAAHVNAIDGDKVMLEITDDAGGALKVGDEIQLLKSKAQNVYRVPASAMSKSQGGADQVFVLVGEIVKARVVAVAERSGDDVFVNAGLTKGDRVVLYPAPTLHDAQKAVAD